MNNSTCSASTEKQTPININDLANAIADVKNQMRDITVIREYHLHPDDYASLKAQAQPFMRYSVPFVDHRESFMGIKIIKDAAAQRLERK